MKSDFKSEPIPIANSARILMALNLFYGGPNAYLLAIWIAMFLLSILFSGSNPKEESSNMLMLALGLTLLPFAALPVATAYSLFRGRTGAKLAVAASAAIAFLTSHDTHPREIPRIPKWSFK
jgi:hypothetical protein